MTLPDDTLYNVCEHSLCTIIPGKAKSIALALKVGMLSNYLVAKSLLFFF